MLCVFCAAIPDSHDHIFFECVYPTEVWNKVCRLTTLNVNQPKWVEIVKILEQLAKKSSIAGLICRLVFGASVYFIWQERNNRVFKKGCRSCEQLFQTIFNTVRLKIASLQIKNDDIVKSVSRAWKIDEGAWRAGI